jgi:imidazolonepropionase-like amidohydrolase
MRTIIVNARIFDGTGAESFAGSVAIEGNRIVQVSQGEMAAADGDQVIDGAGKTLMPGMVEAHAHLSWGSSVEKIYQEMMLPTDELREATWRNARILLDHGFTSAYSAGALGDGLEVELAADIAAGETPGPRLIPSTLERSPEGDEGIMTGDIFNGRGPEAMRRFVGHCAATGVQSVKLVISGESALRPGASQHLECTEEEVAAAGAAARDAGLWLAAHTYMPEAIQMALKHGVRVVYHCSWADAETIDMMAQYKDRIFFAPAVGVQVATLEATPPPHIDMSGMKENAKTVIALDRALIPELKRRGVKVLIGGDYGFPFNPNGRNARDLEHFVELFGYTPSEALVAATSLGGEIMGMADELGVVAPGYLADLLLIDGDPTQDVRILQDKDRIAMIMKDGQLYKAPARQVETA